MSALASFHPAVADWFARTFAAPTPAQEAAWPAIQAGTARADRRADRIRQDARGVPRGDRPLVRGGRRRRLPDETRSSTSRRSRLCRTTSTAISRRRSRASASELAALGLADVPTSAPSYEPVTRRRRAGAMRRRPPHIVVTTPESLYILLGSQSGRDMLASTRTVIVDEIHARGRQQARRAPGAVARAPRGACGAPAGAHRTIGDAEADRGGGAFL